MPQDPSPEAGRTAPPLALPEREAIRRRPAMYVGDTGALGLLHLVYEVLANAVDLFLVGRCSRIELTLTREGAVRVSDDGPGFPAIDEAGRPLLHLALVELHQGPTKDGHPVHVHLDALGLGLSVVHALSERIEVRTAWRGRRWVASGGVGRLDGPPRDEGATDERGTSVLFRPDPTIFPGAALDVARLGSRLSELSALCPGLTLRFTNEQPLEFFTAEGLSPLLGTPSTLRPRRESFWPDTPLGGRAAAAGMSVEFRLRWSSEEGPQVRSFVNLVETPGGGSHEAGLRRGLVELPRALGHPKPERLARALERRIVAVVSVFHFNPTFRGPTRDSLDVPELEPFVAAAVGACLREFAATRPEDARGLVLRATRR